MQAVSEVHEMSSSSLAPPGPVRRFGLRCIDQVVPFHRSTSVCSLDVVQSPTAVQAVVEVHDTPRSSVSEPTVR